MTKQYPVYEVRAYFWNPNREEHDLRTVFESQSKDEAMEYFMGHDITPDMPELIVVIDDGEYVDDLWMKDESGMWAIY